MATSFYDYRISANSFRENYSFLNLTLCTVTFGDSTYRCGNYSRGETIRGNTVVTIADDSPLDMKENRLYCLKTVKLTVFLIIVQLFLTKFELFEL